MTEGKRQAKDRRSERETDRERELEMRERDRQTEERQTEWEREGSRGGLIALSIHRWRASHDRPICHDPSAPDPRHTDKRRHRRDIGRSRSLPSCSSQLRPQPSPSAYASCIRIGRSIGRWTRDTSRSPLFNRMLRGRDANNKRDDRGKRQSHWVGINVNSNLCRPKSSL